MAAVVVAADHPLVAAHGERTVLVVAAGLWVLALEVLACAVLAGLAVRATSTAFLRNVLSRGTAALVEWDACAIAAAFALVAAHLLPLVVRAQLALTERATDALAVLAVGALRATAVITQSQLGAAFETVLVRYFLARAYAATADEANVAVPATRAAVLGVIPVEIDARALTAVQDTAPVAASATVELVGVKVVAFVAATDLLVAEARSCGPA